MVWLNRGKHTIFDRTAASVGEPPLDLLLDRVLIALMQTSYTPNIDTDEQFDDISASEISALGYVARGDSNPLAGKGIVVDNTNDRSEFDATDLVYSSIGGGPDDTFDQIVVMREQDAGATDANTELIATVVVPSTTTNGGNITLVFDAEGLLHITA